MLNQLILNIHNKATIQKIVAYVGTNPKRLKVLLELFLGNNVRISQQTSWALSNIGEIHPEMFQPYHQLFLDKLQEKQVHNAIRRNIVRMYQFMDIPSEFEGPFYDLALQYLLDPNEAIAVRAFSMRICENIALKYPEMIPELIQAIETVVPNGSSGLKNRAGHVLRNLHKHQ